MTAYSIGIELVLVVLVLCILLPIIFFLVSRDDSQVEDLQSARERLQRLSQLFKDKGKPDESVKSLVALGNLMKNRCRTDEAFVWYERALELSKKLRAVDGHRVALHDYSLLIDEAGRSREAIAYAREAVEISLKGSDCGVQANMHSTLAYFLQKIGEIQEADKISRRAMELATQSKNIHTLLYAQHVRAILEWTRGNREKTFELLDSAEKLLPSQGQDAASMRLRRILLLLTRAWYKEEIGKYDEVLGLLDQAKHRSTALDFHLIADLCLVRVLVLAKSGRYKKARMLLSSDEPFMTARSLPCHNAHHEQAAGVVAFAAKEYSDAIAQFRSALDFFEKAEQKRAIALACKYLARAYRETEDALQADQHRRRALDIFVALGDRVSASEIAKL